MKVGELIAALSKHDPDLPVVMSQEDEPCGDYEVLSVRSDTMCHSRTYDPEPRVWGHYGSPADRGRNDDEPQAAVFLSPQRPYRPIIDADLIHAALPSVSGGERSMKP